MIVCILINVLFKIKIMFIAKLFIKNQFSKIVKKSTETLSITPPKQPQIKVQSSSRLSKLITQQSVCSRRQAQKIISMGLIRINGKRIFQNISVPDNYQIKLFTNFGIRKEKPITKLWMMNKPRGYICSENDPEKRPTIYSLMPDNFKIFGHIMSVGRLDFNSQGLLLLTNNNTLKEQLQNPKSDLTRFYRVKVHGRVTDQKIEKMQKGVTINGIHYGPFDVSLSRELSTNVWLNIGLRTGKNRQIRKVLQKCDLQVNKLIRVEYGPFKLGSLKHGEIMDLQIPPKYVRLLQKKIIEKLSTNKDKKTLIEIDVRSQAFKLVKEEQNKKIDNTKLIQN